MYLQKKNSFFIFVLIGIINTLLGYTLIFFFLDILGFSFLISTLFGYTIGFFNGFFLNRRFTYQSTEKIPKAFLKFFLVFVLSYLLSYYSGIFAAFIFSKSFSFIGGNMKLQANIAVLCGAIIYTITNYVGNRFFTFKK